MKHFTAIEYVKIDIANQMGLDKFPWEDRIKWTNDNEHVLEVFADKADDHMLYTKAVYALRDAQAGEPTGYVMGLDATASGLQVMAALSGCFQTASNVNLINTGKREDIYEKVANEMNKILDEPVTRATVSYTHLTLPTICSV